MMFSRSLLPVAVLGLFVGLAQAQEAAPSLNLGDPAPKLQVGKWVKGEPVKELQKGQVYVVEFWATWCGPCRVSIPHLTELQKKHKEAIFIGVDAWEQDESKVEPFVKEMGDKMDYRVAMDDKSSDEKGWMATHWMDAAGEHGIPTAFIIDKEGKIAWIGHPMEMEKPLEQVINGTYDVAKTKQTRQLQQKLQTAMENNDTDAMLKAAEELVAVDPSQKPMLLSLRFQVALRKQDYDQANKVAQQISEEAKDQPALLSGIAYALVQDAGNPKPDYDLAERLATTANDATAGKDPTVLHALAAVYAKRGNLDKAISTQKKAVDAAGDDAQLKEFLQRALSDYQQKKAS